VPHIKLHLLPLVDQLEISWFEWLDLRNDPLVVALVGVTTSTGTNTVFVSGLTTVAGWQYVVQCSSFTSYIIAAVLASEQVT